MARRLRRVNRKCVRQANSTLVGKGPAIQELRADLDEGVAGQQASAAIHFASVFHTKWPWHGVGGSPRKLWGDESRPMTHRVSNSRP